MTSGTTPRPNPARGPLQRGKDVKGRDTGEALRSVYQKTVEEDVPDDLLDLLGKLD